MAVYQRVPWGPVSSEKGPYGGPPSGVDITALELMLKNVQRAISFPVSQFIKTETSIPCLIPQRYNRPLGGYNAGVPDVILGLCPWSCCSSNPFTIGQLQQVG